MKTLHLIVHKVLIGEEISSSLTPKEKLPRLESVLKRINQIEATEVNVKHVLWDNDDPDIPQGIHHVTEFCKGYDLAILYGIARSVCLAFVAKKLLKIGIPVAYDLQGTID